MDQEIKKSLEKTNSSYVSSNNHFMDLRLFFSCDWLRKVCIQDVDKCLAVLADLEKLNISAILLKKKPGIDLVSTIKKVLIYAVVLL